MKKFIAILLAILCMSTLFIGCGESTEKKAEEQPKKATFNFGGNGLEFGMTKKEINAIGKKVTKKDEFDIDSTFYTASITKDDFRDSFVEGVKEAIYPIIQYCFDEKDKLYSVRIWAANVKDGDAETMLQNVMSKYGQEDEYKETEYYGISAYAYEADDIKVIISYDYLELMEKGAVEIYLTAPGYDHPPKAER